MRNENLGLCIDQDARCPGQCRCANHQHTASNCAQPLCNPCGDAPAPQRCGVCPHAQDCPYARPGQHCGQRNTPAMVYAAAHRAENIFSIDQAICRGTLFPCLDKPMANECPGNPCFTKEQALNFAAWELRLYLTTHPCDEKAQALLRRLCQEMHDAGYACALMPCSHSEWLHGPWPWEYSPCCRKEG